MNPDLAAMFSALSAVAAASPTSEGGFVPSLTPSPMPYDILTPSQAAGYLQVDEAIVIKEADSGRLPGQKLGGEWRFLRLAITEWLRSGQAPKIEPKPKSSKERMLALAGMWKDDPTVDTMVAEIYERRKANQVEGK